LGKNVQVDTGSRNRSHSLKAYEQHYAGFAALAAEFFDDLVSHYVLDEGRLVVAHAGLKEPMQGRGSGAVREFCLYGETTGETTSFGLPVRYPWAQDYRGKAMVVYGHTPVPEPEWLNCTINIDTGCVFGGRLTALRLSGEGTGLRARARDLRDAGAAILPEAAAAVRSVRSRRTTICSISPT
jgi:protein phosphatase